MKIPFKTFLATVMMAAFIVSGSFLAASDAKADNYTSNSTQGEFMMSNDNMEHSQGFWEKTKESAAKAWDKTKEVSSDAWEATKETTAKAGDAISEKSEDAWEATKEGTAKAGDVISEKSKDAWEATKEGSEKAWDKTKELSSDAWEKTKDGAHKAKEAISGDDAGNAMYNPENNATRENVHHSNM